MCFKNKKCCKCNQLFHKNDLYYHKHFDKYWKTYWCWMCLEKHSASKSNIRYKLL